MKLTTADNDRARRNLNPHAEARLAMAIWSHEYAHEQRGGSMDFWDSLSPSRQRLCVDLLDEVLAAIEKTGRATTPAGRLLLSSKLEKVPASKSSQPHSHEYRSIFQRPLFQGVSEKGE